MAKVAQLSKRADEQHIVFTDVTWGFYEAVLRENPNIPSYATYDEGTLEIMTLSAEHEYWSRIVGRFIGMASLEFDVPIASLGSTTLKQIKLKKGLEPSECFYFKNERKIRGKKRLDLKVDPPPDLVVEVDVTHAVLQREGIYAAFGVPELWKIKNGQVTFFVLVDAEWEEVDDSLSLPFLRSADLNRFLRKLPRGGETQVIKQFRDWLRTLPRAGTN